MRIAVTGGLGFIGSNIVKRLEVQDNELFVIDNLSGGKDHLGIPSERIKVVNRDILHFSHFIKEINDREGQVDLVIHCAAQVSVPLSCSAPQEDARTNIMGSLEVLETCRNFGIKNVIFISTGGAIYGDDVSVPTKETEQAEPKSPYGIAKLTVEKYLNYYKDSFGMQTCSLRLANVYGKGSERGAVSNFIWKGESGVRALNVFGGDQTRDFVHVNDVISAVEIVIRNNLQGVFNVSTGVETSIKELAEKIVALDVQGYIQYWDPINVGEVQRSCLDATKLRAEGWQPEITLDEGLKMCL